MKQRFWVWLVMVLVSAHTGRSAEPAAAATAAEKAPAPTATIAKDYPLPEVGTLHLAVPKTWRDSFKKTLEAGSRVDELKFLPAEGSNYVVMVYAIHMLDGRKVREFDPKSVVLESVKEELKGSVETTPEVHNFSGPNVTGSYLSLTDKSISGDSPKAGEFKYLTTGYAKLGTLILSFRVLSNRPGGEEKSAALEMVKSARLTAGN
jgi:hypothetical protein